MMVPALAILLATVAPLAVLWWALWMFLLRPIDKAAEAYRRTLVQDYVITGPHPNDYKIMSIDEEEGSCGC